MKIIHKHQTKIFQNSPQCTAIEYPLGDKDINAAIIKLEGRYPEKGRVVNERCKELIYVLTGGGIIEIEGKTIEINKGDQVLIDMGEKYYLKGKMTLFAPCTPAWYPQQHKFVT